MRKFHFLFLLVSLALLSPVFAGSLPAAEKGRTLIRQEKNENQNGHSFSAEDPFQNAALLERGIHFQLPFSKSQRLSHSFADTEKPIRILPAETSIPFSAVLSDGVPLRLHLYFCVMRC